MKECCEAKAEELKKLRHDHSGVLKIVLFVNALMFFVEAGAGWFSGSTALMADSLDMLGDSIVYGFSLYVLDKGITWQARASLLKGALMFFLGAGILLEATLRSFSSSAPLAGTMGITAALALIANLICAMLLLKYRNDDINMRSTWLCSRNDVLSNIGVLATSYIVAITNQKWPDIVVGVLIASIFLHSSWLTIRESYATIRERREWP